MNTIPYGGGVHSTALLVLTAQGHIPYDAFLFAKVGDDSEHPARCPSTTTVCANPAGA
ncbi:hypothetical protein ACQEVG_21530 [Streptomyces sp. CA-135486]|uniref:hypothetical protein n=1 Tax=Streptomyces sp. CA-135486 TaxID=3240049 RepID=UPI003D8B8A95